MIVEELTTEQFDLIVKFQTFIINNLKEVEKLKINQQQQIFVIADTLIKIIESIREEDGNTFFYIIQRLLKTGEQNDRNDS